MSTQPPPVFNYGQAFPGVAPRLRRRRSSRSFASEVVRLVFVWHERWYYRRELKRMMNDVPHLIGDIGLTKSAVEAEIRKPFWEA